MLSDIKPDIADIVQGIRKVRIAVWMATEDMRARYTRTALGPWWGILSTIVFIMAMGITFGSLFRQPIQEYLPYVAAGIGCWTFLSSIITEGPGSLLRASGIIATYPLPLSTQIYRLVADKVYVFLHFLLVYVVLVIVMQVKMDYVALAFFIPAGLIYIVAAVGILLSLSVLGARFRDLAPAVGAVMTMAFLLTPVFWQKVTLTPENHWIADFNPFYHLLEIGRRPLLGQFAAPEHWIASISIAVFCLLTGVLTFAALRRKIYYWL